GQILISHLCNRLHSNTICALMCFGDWSRFDLFMPVELEAMLKEEDDDAQESKLFVDNELILV
ncbi:hypothetical protein BT96DRAFT_828261, partial [Gymnopus androsaceus JB14]